MLTRLKLLLAPRYREGAGATAFFAAVIAATVLAWVGPHRAPLGPDLANGFWVLIILFAFAVMGLGVAAKGHPLGAVMDQRNRLSLSRLQMLLWTILMLATLLALAAWRLAHGFGANAAEIDIPSELLTVMGISVGSLVASPLVLSLKPTDSRQSVAVNGSALDAQLMDLIRGDEEGNRDTIDLSKLQQLAITLVLIGIYGGMVYSALFAIQWDLPAKVATFTPSQAQFHLPPFSPRLVELLGISHAGYLLYKAAPKPEPSATASRGAVSDIGNLSDAGS